MADTKISALGAATALGGTEQIPAVQGGVNVRLTPAQLKTYFGLQTITLTGDVTGSGTGSFAATLGANVVTFSKLVAATAAGIVGATAAGNYAQLTPAQAKAVLAITATDVSGLATVATTGSAADLTAGTLAVARLPAHSGGDVTSSAGSGVLTIGANAVTFSKLVAASGAGLVGATAAGNFAQLTATQATALLNGFTSALAGLVPASGGGTTNYLRADGTWAAPAGGGGGGVQNNFAATADPVATNDSGSGYAAGSVWMRSDTGDIWQCRSAAAGAAKWVRLDASDFPGYVAGNWYNSYLGTANSGATIGANSLRLMPWLVKQRCTISDLAVRVTTGGGNTLLGIYASNPVTKNPTGTALATTASFSTAATGAVSAALTANVTLDPGLYWLALLSDSAVVVYQAPSNGTSPWVGNIIGDATLSNVTSSSTTTMTHKFLSAQTFASGFPDLTSATLSSLATPACAIVFFKVTSVP